MKKSLVVFAAAALLAAGANAQVLQKEQMKNTVWTGIGSPLDTGFMIHGFTDTFQVRFDRGKFTIDAMLNWGLLANYDNGGDVDRFVFGTSNQNPLSLKYGTRGGGAYAGDYHGNLYGYNNQANVSNTLQESYYVNFIYHIVKNFDVGIGTNLNWQVGPAPRYGSWLWEADAHVRQGGFSTAYDDRSGSVFRTSSEDYGSYKYYVDRPGTADVVGFVPYANKYARRAFGARFKTDDGFLELGAAMPNGFNTHDPAVNFGAQIAPAKWLSFAAVLEGAFESQANFYTGATIGFDILVLDLYFAADSLFTKADDDMAFGTGAAVTFTIPNTKISLRPEIGLNIFEHPDYTPSWYTGGSFDLPLTKQLAFNIWGSFAVGSRDKSWKDSNATDDWIGGQIFDIRPELTFDMQKDSLAVYFDFEWRHAFDKTSRHTWSTGLFWTHIF